MQKQEIVYTTKICRLCLAPTLTYFSLTEDTEASQMLESLTTLRILPTDEISTVTCLKCLLSLKLAFKTQQNILNAEQKFRKKFVVKVEEIFEDIEINEQEISDTIIIQVEEPPVAQMEAETALWLCDICNHVEKNRRLLAKHRYEAHTNRKCPNCKEEIRVSNYPNHIIKCKPTEPVEPLKTELKCDNWICDICNIVKPTKKILQNHIYSVHTTKKCTFCDKDVSASNFTTHLAKCDPMKSETHVCDICGITKSTKMLLIQHKYNVHKTRQCPKCLVYVKTSQFSKHVPLCGISDLEEHRIKNGHSCNICGVVKLSKFELTQHKYITHLKEKCPICNKMYPKVNLKSHLERHKGTLVVCEFCGKSVKKQSMKIHYRSHIDVSHKCRFCEKKYRTKARVLMHENKEHLDNPTTFLCQTCGKVFYQKTLLNKHIHSTHLKLRPYVCEFCNVGFSSKFILNKHRRRHINETPFKM